MTKKERVLAVMAGNEPDFTPTSFSLHFPEEELARKGMVQAHLDFFDETDVDIYKIMNENKVPSVPGINQVSDWKRIPTFSKKDSFIQEQADAIKEIRDKSKEDALIFCTIHGTCASTVHVMRPQYENYRQIREIQHKHYLEQPEMFLDATKRIAEAQLYMVEEAIRAGADGIYFAALGGEEDIYSSEEFATIIAPFDIQIMDLCKSMGKIVALHMCKKGLNFQYFDPYINSCDIVNWGVFENNLSLSEGRKIFGNKVYMGGLANRDGVLVTGTALDIESSVHQIIREADTSKFILGADCTLPSGISYARVNSAVLATRSFGNN